MEQLSHTFDSGAGGGRGGEGKGEGNVSCSEDTLTQ